MGRLIYLLPLCLAVVLSSTVYWKHRIDLDAALQNYRYESHDHAVHVAREVEWTFGLMYQGLRTIARLPGVRDIGRYVGDAEAPGGEGGFDDNARETVQEIYNNIANNVAMSEVYIVPVDLQPDEIDAHTGRLQEPITTFDELIVGRNADKGEGGQDDDHGEQLEEIEIHEYRLMKRQLAWMRNNFPRIESISGLEFPAIGGPQVVTCDNTRFSPSRPDDQDRSGLVYSLPFYRPDGELKGCISGVILTHALSDLLPTGEYALRNVEHDYLVVPHQEGQWQASRHWVTAAQPAPGLLCSEILPLSIHDSGGQWVLWTGRPDAIFRQRADVKTARHAAVLGYAGASFLAVGLWLVIFLDRRNRRVLAEKNIELEQRVEERTGELVKEIAERRATEDELRKLSVAVEQSPASVVITDTRGTIEYVNPRFTETAGYTAEEAIGQNPRILKSGHTSPDEYGRLWQTICAGGVWRGEFRNKRKSGELYWVAASISPARNLEGVITHFLSVEEDITERKQAEQEFRQAKEVADASSRAKSEFLANMSHEIRTPLNGILGFTDLLIRGADEGNEVERQDWYRTMHSSGQHLLALINDILDLSKIEAGELEVERIRSSPHLVVAEVASMLRPRAQEKGLPLEVCYQGALPATIESDPTRFRQLLVNLVGNAIKFTKKGAVRIAVGLKDGDSTPKLSVDVVDTGAGIPADALEGIFDPFVQADSSVTRTFGGTGLGLAISRRIALALGGDISVKSETGKGSTFTVEIETGPLDGVKMIDEAAAEALITEHATPAPSEPPVLSGRVLIVDDGETNRKLIGLLLRRTGLEVITAEHGQAAVELARSGPLDLILMDMQMPVMDGYTATRTLRSEGIVTPIIALTASAMRGDEEKCRAVGCTGYLTKPVDSHRLVNTVAHALGNADPVSGRTYKRESKNAASETALVSTLPMDDHEFREIVEDFVERLSDRLDAMREAWAARDLDELAELAHWLKGVGGTVGLDFLVAPAAKLEQLSMNGDTEHVETTIAELVQLAGRIVVDPLGDDRSTWPPAGNR